MAERWTADGGWCAVGPDRALSLESVAPVSAIFWRLVLCYQFSVPPLLCFDVDSHINQTAGALGRMKEQKHRMQSPSRQIFFLPSALRRKTAHPTYSTRR